MIQKQGRHKTRPYENMKYDPDKYHRRSIRLKGYDYSQAGAYFVTICTQDRECLFRDIIDGKMRLNDVGQMVKQCWDDIPVHFHHVELDEFVVMPNHFHGIIVIVRDDCRGEVSSPISLGGETPPLQKRTLGQIVAFFKYQSAKQINFIRDTPGYPVWQSNFYEHIIRSEEELNRIREYIMENPRKWIEDEDNPANITHRRGGSRTAPTTQTAPTNF